MDSSKYYINLFQWTNTNGRISPRNLCGYETDGTGIQEAMHNVISNYKGNETGLITRISDSNGNAISEYVTVTLNGANSIFTMNSTFHVFINGVFYEVVPQSVIFDESVNFCIYIDSNRFLNMTNLDDVSIAEITIPLYAKINGVAQFVYDSYLIESNKRTQTHNANQLLFSDTISLKNADVNVDAADTDLVETYSSKTTKIGTAERLKIDSTGVELTGDVKVSTDGVNSGTVYNTYDHPNVMYAADGGTVNQLFNNTYADGVGTYLQTTLGANGYSGLLLDLPVSDISVFAVGKLVASNAGSIVPADTNSLPVIGLCVSIDTDRITVLVQGTYNADVGYPGQTLYKGGSGAVISDISTLSDCTTEVVGIGLTGNIWLIDLSHVQIEV